MAESRCPKKRSLHSVGPLDCTGGSGLSSKAHAQCYVQQLDGDDQGVICRSVAATGRIDQSGSQQNQRSPCKTGSAIETQMLLLPRTAFRSGILEV